MKDSKIAEFKTKHTGGGNAINRVWLSEIDGEKLTI
jgi:hypothetical protein